MSSLRPRGSTRVSTNAGDIPFLSLQGKKKRGFGVGFRLEGLSPFLRTASCELPWWHCLEMTVLGVSPGLYGLRKVGVLLLGLMGVSFLLEPALYHSFLLQ